MGFAVFADRDDLGLTVTPCVRLFVVSESESRDRSGNSNYEQGLPGFHSHLQMVGRRPKRFLCPIRSSVSFG